MKYTQLKLINEIYTCKLNEVISQEHTHTIMKLLSMIYKGKLANGVNEIISCGVYTGNFLK